MFQRPHLKELISRIKEPRKLLQVIMGPRQVGKTTLVNQLAEEIGIQSYFVSSDAVPFSDGTWLVQQWETARQRMAINGSSDFLLIIDEIQKISNWSETVKLLWDTDSREKRPLKVILLGSSRLLLQQGLTESLAGRFETTYMSHWSFLEMRTAFDWTLDQYIWFGGYPGSADMIGNEERWKNYISQSLIETSISKDILMLTRVNKPALMRRLFELGCHYSGQILSFTKILGQLQDAGNTVTLAHYLELLDTAGLLGGIEKYTGDIIRKRGSSPKFQVHNTALISAQCNEFFEDVKNDPKEWGRIVESSIGAHLVNSSLTEGFKIYYWREGNSEVDFILERRGKVIGLEVKSGDDQNRSGLSDFQKQFNPDKILLIGKSGITVEEFLTLNPVSLF